METFLIAVGAVWGEARLSYHAEKVAYAGFLYGGYANWAVTTFAAVFGTTAMTPLTGAGQAAQPWANAAVTAGFGTVGIAMIAASVVLLWGFRGDR